MVSFSQRSSPHWFGFVLLSPLTYGSKAYRSQSNFTRLDRTLPRQIMPPGQQSKVALVGLRLQTIIVKGLQGGSRPAFFGMCRGSGCSISVLHSDARACDT